jgi:ectoine hydroxylase-related dioxygenase (phytanoyl-CoA dioxygenase family)
MELTPAQRRHYDEHGYIVVENALDPEDLAPVIADYERFIDTEARSLHAEGGLAQLWQDEPFERRLARICEQDTTIYERIDLMYCRLPGVFGFLRNPRLLDLLEGLLGPEIICSPIQHARAKLPEALRQGDAAGDEEARQKRAAMVAENVAPWHQDAQVHLEVADPHPIVTVWVPLVDATPDNGCLQVIPRVHHERVVYWSEGFGVSDDHLPEGAVVTLPMRAGDLLFMDKLIPHRSTENHTDAIRWSLDLRYQRAGTPTGRDDYPVFLARSRADQKSELTEYEEWSRLWVEAMERTPYKERSRRHDKPTAPQPIEILP